MKKALLEADDVSFREFAVPGSEIECDRPWVDVPDECDFDWSWNGDEAVPPPAPVNP